MSEIAKKRVSKLIAFFLFFLIPLGLYSNWIQTTFKNQDSFINVFSLQAENTKLKILLIDSTFKYIEDLKLEETIRENLPDAISPLSSQIEQEIKRTLKVFAHELINSSAFEMVWNKFLISIHQELTKVIIDESQGYLRVYANELYVTSAPIKERLISNLSNDPTWRNFTEELNTIEAPKIRVLNAEQLDFVKIIWVISSLVNKYLPFVLIFSILLLVGMRTSILESGKYLGLSIFSGGSTTLLIHHLFTIFLNARLTNNLAEEMLVIFFNSASNALKINAYITILIGLVILGVFFIQLKTRGKN